MREPPPAIAAQVLRDAAAELDAKVQEAIEKGRLSASATRLVGTQDAVWFLKERAAHYERLSRQKDVA